MLTLIETLKMTPRPKIYWSNFSQPISEVFLHDIFHAEIFFTKVGQSTFVSALLFENSLLQAVHES